MEKTERQDRPCRELTALREDYGKFKEETTRRLAAGDISMATINTKLNWLIGILSAIGVAALSTALKILVG